MGVQQSRVLCRSVTEACDKSSGLEIIDDASIITIIDGCVKIWNALPEARRLEIHDKLPRNAKLLNHSKNGSRKPELPSSAKAKPVKVDGIILSRAVTWQQSPNTFFNQENLALGKGSGLCQYIARLQEVDVINNLRLRFTLRQFYLCRISWGHRGEQAFLAQLDDDARSVIEDKCQDWSHEGKIYHLFAEKFGVAVLFVLPLSQRQARRLYNQAEIASFISDLELRQVKDTINGLQPAANSISSYLEEMQKELGLLKMNAEDAYLPFNAKRKNTRGHGASKRFRPPDALRPLRHVDQSSVPSNTGDSRPGASPRSEQTTSCSDKTQNENTEPGYFACAGWLRHQSQEATVTAQRQVNGQAPVSSPAEAPIAWPGNTQLSTNVEPSQERDVARDTNSTTPRSTTLRGALTAQNTPVISPARNSSPIVEVQHDQQSEHSTAQIDLGLPEYLRPTPNAENVHALEIQPDKMPHYSSYASSTPRDDSPGTLGKRSLVDRTPAPPNVLQTIPCEQQSSPYQGLSVSNTDNLGYGGELPPNELEITESLQQEALHTPDEQGNVWDSFDNVLQNSDGTHWEELFLGINWFQTTEQTTQAPPTPHLPDQGRMPIDLCDA